MLEQKKPNKCSCLATAFSSVIDEPIEPFMSQLGHDGMKIVNDSREPICYRGHHIQEIIDLLLKKGYAVTELAAWPCFSDGAELFGEATASARIFVKYIPESKGVLFGRWKVLPWNHAIVNMFGSFFDPDNGKQIEYPDNFDLITYYKVDKICS